jgi:hypothetical protein
MWKRDEAVKPASGEPATQSTSAQAVGQPSAQTETRGRSERDVVNIGKSVVIKGELSGSEDLTIEGVVDGKIELRDNILTIGPNGRIKAQVFAKAVIVLGEVTGNVTGDQASAGSASPQTLTQYPVPAVTSSSVRPRTRSSTWISSG